MLKVAFLVSGGGSNLQAVIDQVEEGVLSCEIVKVISSNKEAYALDRAKKHGIPSVVLQRKDFPDQEAFDQALLSEISSAGAELVVAAGYLGILSENVVNAYHHRILNIHPSLIPSFCGKGYYGLRVHEAVLERGVRVTGATVHFMDEGTDTGPIVLQKAVNVLSEDTPESLQQRVMAEGEWVILPRAIELIAEGRITIEGKIVKIKEAAE